jgi:polysaccharide export outer membrane protein
MKNPFELPFALLMFMACSALHSQSVPTVEAGQAQETPSADCTSMLLAPGEPCTQNPTANQQLSPRARPFDESGVIDQRRLGQPGQESDPLSEPHGNRASNEVLPPDRPTEFQKFVAATTGQFLPLYGEDLFRRVPSTFSPDSLAPATPDYIIGPDDELRVRIWGQVNYSGNLRVDRSGSIYLPQVGSIPVAGLQFSALDQHLRAAIARIYRNFDLSVDMGRTRSMQIYVSGQARRPGAYTVSSLSSLVNALFATGGPSPQGSLRHILLNRNGKTITDFDLYGLLIHGDKSKDVRLLPEDVLYIPATGPQVAVTGSVRQAGIYELRESETIGDVLQMAGGTSAIASNSRISLERVEQRQVRQAMEFGFNASGLAETLTDGDILRIYSILPAYEKTVTLRGDVANPGRFGWRPGMRLSDLIPDQDSLMSRDYWWKRSHLGLPGPEFEPIITSIGENQQSAENGSRGLTTSVTQSTLTDALSPNVAPRPTSGQSTGTSNGTLASGLAQAPTQNGDQGRRTEVRAIYAQINWNYAVIERTDPESLKPSLIPFELGKLVLNHDASQNLELQPGDIITVFSQNDVRVPIEQQVKYIELEGEFVRSGFYSVLPGETLRDVVQRAGGLTSRAYLYGSEFTRESTRILQQQRLDEYVRTVSLESERGTQALAITGSSSTQNASDVAASRAVAQEMINRLSQVRATGRIVLEFQPKSTTMEEIPAFTLENGDKFVVPFAPLHVNVVGSVYDQNSYVYQHGQTVAHYLRLAGGPNRNADRHHSFVIRADGSVVSEQQVKGSKIWNNSFEDLRLSPGDTIVVPEKTLRPTALRGLMDWSQIFSQLALGAAAINVL